MSEEGARYITLGTIEPYTRGQADRIAESIRRAQDMVPSSTMEEHMDNVERPQGEKTDSGKQEWFALPLEILHPLADVMAYGEEKYGLRNCLNPFVDPERRFFNAAMRHMEECQKDPLAIDPESNCYHAASVAFSMLMMIYHCGGTKK